MSVIFYSYPLQLSICSCRLAIGFADDTIHWNVGVSSLFRSLFHNLSSSDAVALNMGSDSWQPGQIQNAYTAALGTPIKLFISFDFTSFPCNLQAVVALVNQYANHPNQLKVNGKVFISSYSGECLGNSGWASLKAQTNGYVMPFIWGLEGQFNSWPSLDSWYWLVKLHLFLWVILTLLSSWGCAWPQTDVDISVNSLKFMSLPFNDTLFFFFF